MLSVREAQKKILQVFQVVTAQVLPLEQAACRVLAQDIVAETDLPSFDNSMMDGFSLLSTDTSGVSPSNPIKLTVIADIKAGNHSKTIIKSGQATRIMTGAPLPQGTDAVVMVEDTDFNNRAPGAPAPKNVTVYRSVQPGAYIRRRGEDLHTGDKILSKGHRLRAQDIGLLAMLGITKLSVFRLPRIAILSNGDELVPVSEPLKPGMRRDANSYTLSTLAKQAGAEVIYLGIAADTPSAICTLLDRAVDEGADLIASSAGVSVGAFDFILEVLKENGNLAFWKVNMRPGKPLAFGEYRGIPFLGLPGNPVSAFIGFEMFVHPALEKLSGSTFQPHQRQKARLVESIESDGRESYLRAIVDEEKGQKNVRLTGHQGSGNLFSLVQANALLIVPSGVKSLPANSEVEIWPIP